jgi:hypothetical protein
LESLCAAGDIFTPNEVEAISLVGPGTPEQVRCAVWFPGFCPSTSRIPPAASR